MGSILKLTHEPLFSPLSIYSQRLQIVFKNAWFFIQFKHICRSDKNIKHFNANLGNRSNLKPLY